MRRPDIIGTNLIPDNHAKNNWELNGQNRGEIIRLEEKKLQLSRPGVMSSRLLVLLRCLMGLGGEKNIMILEG